MKTALTLFLLTIATMSMKAQELKKVSYKDGTQQLNGLITSNTDKKGPAVLILPAWKGIDNEATQAALQLQKEGYIAFIADIYGEGNIPADNTAASKIAGHYKTDYKAYQQRISAALDQLKKVGADPKKIAVIGYCFGGTGALETARAGLPVAGVVSIHGGLSKSADRPNAAINVKVLVEHPAADKSVSKEDYDGLVKELNEGKADWQIITYANSGHTFTNPESPEYNPVMAKRAWAHTLLFLKEVLN
ncbi:dienelactone hydrolase family protein [Sphingobacterium sp. DR205]|uniref:dienelactone hydrolase family protein n=1 Tax=Sphingobacterium sp. DR205 TaxID=2713573 RepID=UPI0013E46286|nr:dienelactone hydrolase family protein [Sphingobacterium sp. DR205]QIH33051.1 dienelactone hydrolase family protein [Sphingobacterium sp. DR205]